MKVGNITVDGGQFNFPTPHIVIGTYTHSHSSPYLSLSQSLTPYSARSMPLSVECNGSSNNGATSIGAHTNTNTNNNTDTTDHTSTNTNTNANVNTDTDTASSTNINTDTGAGAGTNTSSNASMTITNNNNNNSSNTNTNTNTNTTNTNDKECKGNTVVHAAYLHEPSLALSLRLRDTFLCECRANPRFFEEVHYNYKQVTSKARRVR
jgi:hypothetical protein